MKEKPTNDAYAAAAALKTRIEPFDRSALIELLERLGHQIDGLRKKNRS